MSQQVYFFGDGKAEGNAQMRNLLGGKGANLAEMTNLGLPVPPGYTISTEVCTAYYEEGGQSLPSGLEESQRQAVKRVEDMLGRRFGDSGKPLLFSVRSGARVSMPGMMDTVLNLGLNDETVEGLAKETGNRRFAYDSYRRFIQMFGNVVLGVDGAKFEHALDALKEERGVELDTDLTADDLEGLIETFKKITRDDYGADFPQDPWEQLRDSVMAVFRSWNNARAIHYRNMHGYAHEWGTAVNVQSMVFGNMGDDCATGVAFTRDPSTGENAFYGEYLVNAQGEDVVAGVRTPKHLRKRNEEEGSLEEYMPEAYRELVGIVEKLEDHYRDMLDIEFTIQNDKLWMLQVRSGKRTGAAAVRIAVEMVEEKMIDEAEAVMRVLPEQLDQLLHPMIDPSAKFDVLGKGLPASPGAVSGEIVFTAEEAVERAEAGAKPLLVRKETSPEDIAGMAASAGILTQRGGMTSHAAVVARGMGKCCVAGLGSIVLDEAKGTMQLGGKTFTRGDMLTLNGTTGEVVAGQVPTLPPQLDDNFRRLMGWANERRRLRVRTNADTPDDSRLAREFGAEGIGLCRTEHMFFGEERIAAVREMIVSTTKEQREKAIAKLLPFQTSDFEGILDAMDGLPVTIRLLDPPLHEFLPQDEAEISRLAKEMDVSPDRMHQIVDSLEEFNPMLGHRGCRLGITYPEIYAMQCEAIMRAACKLKKAGKNPMPEIMIPLVGIEAELSRMREVARERVHTVKQHEGVGDELEVLIGTMIEIPRACVTADEIAKEADFFSFGTNDLTQMGFGFSRDDAGTFLPHYVEHEILPSDPFQSLDQGGIGKLVEMAVELGRAEKEHLHLGVCGEHGGDPDSVAFFHRAGLDYVSCSPYRVPVAVLAAARAALDEAAAA
ncbi:MAG TPA: pyruvate, phosphate dikinase [Candidatus Krumholzibacteria bacterium]|nr:pyruvate, phosphate dikinase [Candidatus Krumholzibacteria bacterium]